MKAIFILPLLFLYQTDVPFKVREEFELKLDFEFKSRQLESSTVVYTERNAPKSTGPLPYLSLNLTFLKLSDQEVRVKIVDEHGDNIMSKKVQVGTVLRLDLGFTDDLKGHAEGRSFTVYLLSPDKKPSSRIVIFFEKDGTYRVNGEMRGKV